MFALKQETQNQMGGARGCKIECRLRHAPQILRVAR